MKHKTLRAWIGGIALLAVLATAAFLLRSTLSDPDDHTPDDQVETQENPDLSLLSLPQTPPELFEAALERLSRASHPAALNSALAHVKDSNPLRRKACARAFGYFFDSRANNALKELAADPETSVQKEAIHSLGKRESRNTANPREKIILELLASANEKEGDSLLLVALNAALSEAATTNEQRDAALQVLLTFLEDNDSATGEAAALALIQSAPRNPKILEKLKAAVLAQSPPLVAAAALDHFSAHPELCHDWLPQQLPLLFKAQDKQFRKALIQNLPLLCPPDFDELLGQILRTESDLELRALAEAKADQGCQRPN